MPHASQAKQISDNRSRYSDKDWTLQHLSSKQSPRAQYKCDVNKGNVEQCAQDATSTTDKESPHDDECSSDFTADYVSTSCLIKSLWATLTASTFYKELKRARPQDAPDKEVASPSTAYKACKGSMREIHNVIAELQEFLIKNHARRLDDISHKMQRDKTTFRETM